MHIKQFHYFAEAPHTYIFV